MDGRICAKVLDFGVARLQDSDLTQTGMLVGTFQYMAPEYLQTKKADARCDLFAVGVMLHEALLGNHPEPGPTTPAAPRGGSGAPALLPEPAPGLDPRFLGLVEKAVALDPSQRFQTAAEFSRALRAAQDTKEVAATEALLTAPPHRLLGQGDTIFPSLVTAHPVTGKKVEFKLPPLPAAEPEPWWKRHWGWGVVLLAVLGVARWGLGPEPAARPNSAAPPPPAIQEQRRVPPNSAQNPDPRWALPAGQERGPEPFPRANPGTSPDDGRQPPGPPPMAPEGTLDEARSRLRDHPREALEAAQKVLRTQQGNVHAHALVVAGYYRLREYDDMLAALKNAKANGVDAHVIGGTAVLRELLQEEGQAHRIPPNLFNAMRPYLPPPPEESSQQDRPRGEDPHYPR